MEKVAIFKEFIFLKIQEKRAKMLKICYTFLHICQIFSSCLKRAQGLLTGYQNSDNKNDKNIKVVWAPLQATEEIGSCKLTILCEK